MQESPTGSYSRRLQPAEIRSAGLLRSCVDLGLSQQVLNRGLTARFRTEMVAPAGENAGFSLQLVQNLLSNGPGS